jgi:hypothetical protein
MPSHAMHPMQDYFFGRIFLYARYFDMQPICTAMLAKFYFCKKWVLHRGPLQTLISPLLATIDALLGVVASDIGQRLLAAAWARLPTSLGRKKFSHLVAGGIVGGDAVQLLGGVLENIAVFAPGGFRA